jgi:alpha-L-fucosidase
VSSAPKALTDGVRQTYITDEEALQFDFEQPVEADLWVIQEAIQMGQNIRSFVLKLADENGEWHSVYEGTTVGNKRMIRFDSQKITAVSFEILDTKDEVKISEVGLYRSATSAQ